MPRKRISICPCCKTHEKRQGRSYCAECGKRRAKDWRVSNPDKIRAHREVNRDKIRIQQREYQRECRFIKLTDDQRERYQKKKEVEREYRRVYGVNPSNAEKARRRARLRRELDGIRINEVDRRWRQSNPEKIREYKRRRRARKLNNQIESDVTPEKIVDLKKHSKGKCYWCGKQANKIHIDHVKPLSKGGEHMMYNLVVSCARCNDSKSDKNPQEWGALL